MSKYFLKISYRCTIQKYSKSYLEMNKKKREKEEEEIEQSVLI